MKTIIFDGKEFARRKQQEIKKRVDTLKLRGVTPTLASVFLKTDAGSSLYTKIKGEAARSLDMEFIDMGIAKQDTDSFVAQVEKLNRNPQVHGVLIQKPSGKNDFSTPDWSRIVSSLSPQKDVDGLTPESLGFLTLGTPKFIPATVKAVLEILHWGKIEFAGRHVVVAGASEILGKPLNALLTERDATVTVVHAATPDISRYTKDADILVSATGQPGIIGAEMVKEGAVVIDVGAPKGDVKTEEVLSKIAFLAPVPGGIGPVTVACLLENVIEAAERSAGL